MDDVFFGNLVIRTELNELSLNSIETEKIARSQGFDVSLSAHFLYHWNTLEEALMKEFVSGLICICDRNRRGGIICVFVLPDIDLCFSKINIKYCTFSYDLQHAVLFATVCINVC